jgi:hypothetical protein
MRTRLSTILSGLLLIPGISTPRLAAQLTPDGPASVVSREATAWTSCPQLGVAADGSFEIAWSVGGQPYRFLGRHFDADGSPTDSGAVQLGTSENYEGVQAVTVVPGGFQVLTNSGRTSDPANFHQTRLGPEGQPAPEGPRAVGDRDTSWIGPGPGDTLLAGRVLPVKRLFQLQWISPTGAPSRPFANLNTRPMDDRYPTVKITPLAGGGWVAVWYGTVKLGRGRVQSVLRGRRFSAAGKPLGPDFDIGRVPGYDFVVAADATGGFAVAWDDVVYPFNNPNTLPETTVFLRYFDAAGHPRAPERVVDRGTHVMLPLSAAFDESGRLVLLWLRYPNFYRLHAQLFESDGQPVGQPFEPSPADGDRQLCATVARTGDAWTISWVGVNPLATPRDTLYLRRFRD